MWECATTTVEQRLPCIARALLFDITAVVEASEERFDCNLSFLVKRDQTCITFDMQDMSQTSLLELSLTFCDFIGVCSAMVIVKRVEGVGHVLLNAWYIYATNNMWAHYHQSFHFAAQTCLENCFMFVVTLIRNDGAIDVSRKDENFDWLMVIKTHKVPA